MLCSSDEAQVRKGSQPFAVGLRVLRLLYEALAGSLSSLFVYWPNMNPGLGINKTW